SVPISTACIFLTDPTAATSRCEEAAWRPEPKEESMFNRSVSSVLASTAIITLSLTSMATAADLRMSWWGGESRHVATQKALEACGAKHGHSVKGEFTGFDGYLEKLTTQMAGRTEADIVQVNWPWLPLFSKNG